MTRNPWCSNLLAATLVVAWAFAGCNNATDMDAANDVATREQTVDLDDTYGGYNTADEGPAFIDEALRSAYGPDGDVAFDDASVVALNDRDRRYAPRYLMITWGDLHCDSLISFVTDWSGSLCAENGAVRVLRTIRFEPRDEILTRTSRSCVEWVSHTQPHFDGVIVALYKTSCDTLAEPASVDTLCSRPLSVTFTTGPLTVTFAENELNNLHKIVPVDDAGNAVAFNALRRLPSECAGGFLAGQWEPKPDATDARGVQGWFRGKWVDEAGVHMGYLRGVYGVNGRSQNVFFGKWVAETGRFRGLLAGIYGANEVTDTGGEGWFRGIWFSHQLRSMGGLHGVWETDNDDDPGGAFRGVWVQFCGRDP